MNVIHLNNPVALEYAVLACVKEMENGLAHASKCLERLFSRSKSLFQSFHLGSSLDEVECVPECYVE